MKAKKAVKQESRSKSTRKKALPVKPKQDFSAKTLYALIRQQRHELTCLANQVSAAINTMREYQRRVELVFGESLSVMANRLALLGDFKSISENDGQRLMSVSGGDMTPAYAEWYIQTHTKEEALGKYQNRLNHLPPYLRKQLLT